MKDPYEAVLSDLRDKRRQIDAAIAALEGVQRGHVTFPKSPRTRREATEPRADDPAPSGPKVSIAEAAVEALRRRGRPMTNEELVGEVQNAGIVMRSRDDRNTMGALIRRRAEQVGDVLKVSRGVWALAEWPPVDEAIVADASAAAPDRDVHEAVVADGVVGPAEQTHKQG